MTPTPHPNPFDGAAVADAYDTWFDTPLGATADRLEKDLIHALAQPRAGERALDVGTGTGHFATYLAELGLRVSAVDSSDAMLRQARAKRNDVEWRRAAAEDLPYDDGTFDLVLSVTLLEFVPDPDEALEEMFRVVRPGGRLVAAVLNRESPWARAREEEARRVETPFAHARFFTPEEFARSLGHLGPARWSSAVFVGPDGRGLPVAGLLEAAGRAFRRRHGALLVGRVDRPSGGET